MFILYATSQRQSQYCMRLCIFSENSGNQYTVLQATAGAPYLSALSASREQTHVLCCCFASQSHCYCKAKKEYRNQARQLKAQQEREKKKKTFACLLLFRCVDQEQVIVFRGHLVKWVITMLSIFVTCMSVGDR